MSLLWFLHVTAERALAFFFFFKKEKVKKRRRGREESISFAPGRLSYKPEWSVINATWVSSPKRACPVDGFNALFRD